MNAQADNLSSSFEVFPPTPTSRMSGGEGDISLGVVIVSYNTAALLADCLQSLVTTCTLPHHTIVVDNASSDGSAAMVAASFPHVQLYKMPHNSGFAAGTNMGLRLAGFGNSSPPPHLAQQTGTPAFPTPPTTKPPDYVLLLNPDTVVHTGAIETLVTFLEQHPRVGVASPRLLNPDGSVQAAAFRFPTLSMTLLDLFPPGEVLPGRLYGSWWHGRYPQEHAHPPPMPFPIDHPLGACMLVRREVIETVGLLDEAYFMYSEEVAWCWHIRHTGWAIWQVPQAMVTHVGGAATSQFRHRMFIELHRSRLRFFAHHYTPLQVSLHRSIIRAGMLRAIVRCWLQYAQRCMSREELRARLWAYGSVMHL